MSDKKRRKKVRGCYICGSTVHLARDCPSAICATCGKQGHIPPQCPDTPQRLDLGSFTDNKGCTNEKYFTYCELFSGIGGFRIALDALGGKCVFASEIDKFAKATYKDNFGDTPAGDICQIPTGKIPCHDLLVGGFPCQSWSFAGKRAGFNDPRGKLFEEIIRIASTIKPKAMLLENVRGLITHDNGNSLKKILTTINSIGYWVQWKLQDAVVILPQERKRIFIVCIRKDLRRIQYRFPTFPEIERPLACILETDTLNAKEKAKLQLSERQYQKILKQKYTQKFPKSRFADISLPAKTLMSSYGNIIVNSQFVPGLNGQELPRRFSFREAARLQGFPETFKLHPQRSYVQLGNAVPPPIICMIAAPLIGQLCTMQTDVPIECKGWEITKDLLLAAVPISGGKRESLKKSLEKVSLKATQMNKGVQTFVPNKNECE